VDVFKGLLINEKGFNCSQNILYMTLSGILIGKTANPQQAEKMVTQYTGCPYAALVQHSDSVLIGVFTLPEDHAWWLKGVEENPGKTLKLTYAEVFFTQKIYKESPWSLKKVDSDRNTAPCGSTCQPCPVYQSKCKGCPSTVYYE
jgi:hypothetical protein